MVIKSGAVRFSGRKEDSVGKELIGNLVSGLAARTAFTANCHLL